MDGEGDFALFSGGDDFGEIARRATTTRQHVQNLQVGGAFVLDDEVMLGVIARFDFTDIELGFLDDQLRRGRWSLTLFDHVGLNASGGMCPTAYDHKDK